jgi:hypothetical protein
MLTHQLRPGGVGNQQGLVPLEQLRHVGHRAECKVQRRAQGSWCSLWWCKSAQLAVRLSLCCHVARQHTWTLLLCPVAPLFG